MPRPRLLHLPVLVVAALIAVACSKPGPEPSDAGVASAAKPASESSTEPSSTVVFEVTPDHPYVKLDTPTVALSGSPVVTYTKDGENYAYTLWLHDGPAGAKLTCANYSEEIEKSSVSYDIYGKSPATPKDVSALEGTLASIGVTKPGQPPMRSGQMRGMIVTITKRSETGMSGTVSLPAPSAAAKGLAGSFHNAIVCEET